MKLTPAEWAQLSRLLDAVLELPPEARQGWLDALGGEDAQLRSVLAELLAQEAGSASGEMLGTLPKLSWHPSQALGGPVPAEPAQGSLIGPYRLIREIGRGGMAVVWLAERVDGIPRRSVALKLPHLGSYSPQLAARLARERDILAHLVHPNIAKLLEAGFTDSGQPYLALEFVEGVTITAYCDREALPIRQRLELFLEVLDAVQYAHSRLVTHRDLKPSNILVTADGAVVLLDFGIAKLIVDGSSAETELTQQMGRVLTLEYASPEQISGDLITTASDVYSLGIVLHELLTGERPYRLERESRGALEEAILTADPVRPSLSVGLAGKAATRGTTARKLRNALRGDLDNIILKALRKPAVERYATVNALSADIVHYLRGEPVLAQPDSTWYRAGKFLSRNRLVAGSAAAVVLALGMGLGVALWQAQNAREQARRAIVEAQTAEAVQDFLRDLFRANTVAQADPAKAQLTTARELLDIGEHKIDRALTQAPLAKLKIMKTLADMYDELELDERATRLGLQRVELSRALYGPDSRSLAEALVDFGTLATKLGEAARWQSAFAEAERILDRIGDPGSQLRGRLELGQANGYIRSDLSKARDHVERSIRILRAYPPSEDLMYALHYKAQACYLQGDYRNAVAAVLDELEVAKPLGSAANVLLPEAYANLGHAQAGNGDIAAADGSFRHAVTLARAINGETSDTVLSTQEDLGEHLLYFSHLRESVAVFAEAARLATQRDAAGDDSGYPPQVMVLAAGALIAYGQIEAGLEALQRSQDMIRKLGQRPDLTAPLEERRAAALMDLGRYPEADARLTQAMALRRGVGQEGTPLMNPNRALRARLLMLQGRREQAMQEFAGFLVNDADVNPLSRLSLERLTGRAELLLAAGDLGKADQAAADVLSRIAHGTSRDYLLLWEARASGVRGRVSLRQRRPLEALSLLGHEVELDRQLYDPDRSPILAAALIDLAWCQIDLGQLGAASKLSSTARRIHATHPELGEQFRTPLRLLEGRLATTPLTEVSVSGERR